MESWIIVRLGMALAVILTFTLLQKIMKKVICKI